MEKRNNQILNINIMAEYDFSTLGSSDLEDLVCDLLNAEVQPDSDVKYRTFKDGKDQGIDILYSVEGNDHEHVGQVKHYYRTGFANMLYKLKNEEVAKVVKLNPGKYIFATSVDLGPGDAKTISSTFHPYIKTLGDIYGKQDLNRLIEKHDQVLTIHYKLWFSDASVLTKILNSDLQFRSIAFEEGELTKRMRFYVKTELFDIVRENLRLNNFVIITGDPGVGKTTLAEMLTYEYIKEDYELLYIVDDIKEVERVLREDDSKQIFYFDDFLGSNSAEINRAKGSEGALINIIGRIKRMPNKKLIFTTRNIVLKTVIQESEKFKRFSRNINETVFHLEEYTDDIKTKLLRNHIDESEMDDSLKSVIRRKEISKFITSHQNFNPRSVEFITLNENVEMYSPKQYENYIVENFKNPAEIWKFAYENQINFVDRWLLNTLLTFDGKVDIAQLEGAFNKRVEVCTTPETILPINPFQTSIEKLDRGFLVRKNQSVDFVNPSLKDFLSYYIQTDRREIILLLSSIKYVGQVSKLLLSMADLHGLFLPEELKMDMMVNYLNYTRVGYKDEDLIQLATVINNQIREDVKYNYLVDIIAEINDWESLYKNYELNISFKKFVEASQDNYKINKALLDRTEEIVNDLFLGEHDLETGVELLVNLSETFEINYLDFDATRIISHLDDLFSEYIDNEVENLKDWATDSSEVTEIRENLESLAEKINDLGLTYEVDMSELNIDWDEITRNNELRRLMEKDD